MGGHEVVAPRDCCVLKTAALRHMEVHSAHFEQFEASSSDFCKCCFAMLPLQRELCSESVTGGLNMLEQQVCCFVAQGDLIPFSYSLHHTFSLHDPVEMLDDRIHRPCYKCKVEAVKQMCLNMLKHLLHFICLHRMCVLFTRSLAQDLRRFYSLCSHTLMQPIARAILEWRDNCCRPQNHP